MLSKHIDIFCRHSKKTIRGGWGWKLDEQTGNCQSRLGVKLSDVFWPVFVYTWWRASVAIGACVCCRLRSSVSWWESVVRQRRPLLTRSRGSVWLPVLWNYESDRAAPQQSSDTASPAARTHPAAQYIHNSLARIPSLKLLKFVIGFAPILRSQHWLQNGLTNALNISTLLAHLKSFHNQPTWLPDYIHNPISVQSTCRTRSSAVTLAWPYVSSSLQTTNRSFKLDEQTSVSQKITPCDVRFSDIFSPTVENFKSVFYTSTLWGIKNYTLLTGTITLQNYSILWWFLAYRCTWEYPITCLFDSLCKIENWEPAYQICYWLLKAWFRKVKQLKHVYVREQSWFRKNCLRSNRNVFEFCFTNNSNSFGSCFSCRERKQISTCIMHMHTALHTRNWCICVRIRA